MTEQNIQYLKFQHNTNDNNTPTTPRVRVDKTL